jgi:hypothetical protein
MATPHFSAEWRVITKSSKENPEQGFLKKKGTSPCRKSGLKAASN